LRRTNPIDTALTAAVPISVNTTRRERFMGLPFRLASKAMEALRHCHRKRASESASFHGIVRREIPPLLEKCDVNACANEPKAAARHAAGTGIRRIRSWRCRMRRTCFVTNPPNATGSNPGRIALPVCPDLVSGSDTVF
jgi:hypothetical protein